MKSLLTFLLLSVISFALSPTLSIDVNGTVKEMILWSNELIIATDNEQVEIYDIEKNKITSNLKIPKIKDFMGDNIEASILSVDKIKQRYLLLSDSGINGYSNLWIIENGKREQLIFPSDKKSIIKARFIDKNHILLGYLSNEVALFDVVTKKELYKKQLSESKFSDFALNLDKHQAVFACESGILTIVDTKKGTVLKKLDAVNKDNVFKVAFNKEIITAAGQDRRAAIYNIKNGTSNSITGSFLVYATALSPSSQRVAFALDEENNISIFNTKTREKLFTLKGQKSTLNTIIFKDENTLFTASDNSNILMWKLPKNAKDK
jgi:WD40 repeat protein